MVVLCSYRGWIPIGDFHVLIHLFQPSVRIVQTVKSATTIYIQIGVPLKLLSAAENDSFNKKLVNKQQCF
jgi:hypothetical protein